MTTDGRHNIRVLRRHGHTGDTSIRMPRHVNPLLVNGCIQDIDWIVFKKLDRSNDGIPQDFQIERILGKDGGRSVVIAATTIGGHHGIAVHLSRHAALKKEIDERKMSPMQCDAIECTSSQDTRLSKKM